MIFSERQGVWSSLKRSLANLTKQGIGQLAALIKARLKPVQSHRRLPRQDRARPYRSVTCPVECLPLAGQPLRPGAAAITVYRQHGVLEARVWPLVA